MTKVIIDTDPGIDDALAIALALRSPSLDVLGVTTVYGNASLPVTTRNARHLVQRLGHPQVPVYPGAGRPLIRSPYFAVETHGEEGLGHAVVPEIGTDHRPPITPSTVVEAPLAILRMLADAPEPITIIALGPLTNLALALSLGRDLVTARVGELIWMGGSAGAPGNTTPVSEFNAWSDPEAASAVLRAGLPMRMVGLDATRRVFLSADVVDRLAGHPDPEVRWWAEMWRFYVEFHRRSERLEGCIMNDPLAVALLLAPGLGRWQSMHVTVDCGTGLTRGQTICDRFGFTGEERNVAVCLDADGEKALAVALERGVGVRL